jgi:hypothetical protein
MGMFAETANVDNCRLRTKETKRKFAVSVFHIYIEIETASYTYTVYIFISVKNSGGQVNFKSNGIALLPLLVKETSFF